MNLIIDRGNTKTKLAFFQENDIKEMVSVINEDLDAIINAAKKHPFTNTILASVDNQPKELLAFVSERTKTFINLTHKTPLPIINKYASPETLGVDRLALAVGGVNMFPNKNVLVIDAGTCITFDFVNQHKEYLGGAIAPGIQMRFDAMHQMTEKLPLIKNKHKTTELIGVSTITSMECGVYNHILEEIDGVINRYLANFNNLNIIITGGDGNFFALHSKNKIFADSSLLLKGLNSILQYNVS